jgi:GT2 family glycosyltransferase
MKYRILELDIDHAPPAIRLETDETGFALLVRHRGRLVGFHMQASAPGESWTSERMGELAAGAAAEAMVAQRVLETIEREPPAVPRLGLTIAVCTRDRHVLLARCLGGIRTVLDTRADLAIDVEVLVCDNAPSNDHTRREVERFGAASYVIEPRPGLDFARNAAWRNARHEFIAYIDDDAVPDREWLGGFARAIARHPDAGGVTGLVLPLTLDTEAQILFEERGGWRRGFMPMRYGGAERVGDPCYPVGAGIFGAGCNMVIRRSLLGRLGGFDEALDTGPLLPGGGDLDIFYRIARSGTPLVYEPGLAVFHEHRRDLAGLRRQYYTWGLGFQAFLTKTRREHPDDRAKVSRVRRWCVLHMLRSLLSRLGPMRMVVAEIVGGVVGYFGSYDRSRARVEAIREAHR